MTSTQCFRDAEEAGQEPFSLPAGQVYLLYIMFQNELDMRECKGGETPKGMATRKALTEAMAMWQQKYGRKEQDPT